MAFYQRKKVERRADGAADTQVSHDGLREPARSSSSTEVNAHRYPGYPATRCPPTQDVAPAMIAGGLDSAEAAEVFEVRIGDFGEACFTFAG